MVGPKQDLLVGTLNPEALLVKMIMLYFVGNQHTDRSCDLSNTGLCLVRTLLQHSHQVAACTLLGALAP